MVDCIRGEEDWAQQLRWYKRQARANVGGKRKRVRDMRSRFERRGRNASWAGRVGGRKWMGETLVSFRFPGRGTESLML